LCSVAEEVTHVEVSLFLLWLLLLGLDLGLSLGLSWSTTSLWSGSSSGSKSVSLLETEAGSHGGAGEVLEGVEDHMVHGGLGWHTDGEGHGAHVLGVHVEGLKHRLVGDGKDLGWVHLTVVEDVQNLHSVEEWTDLELVEEGSLTWGDLVTLGNDLNWVNNLDLRLDNLGLNVKGLEERGLLWIHTGWTSWDGHLTWGDGTNLGWGLSDLGVEDLLDLAHISVSEDKTSVEGESISYDVELWTLLTGGLILINQLLDGLSHEGVLSHDHNSTDFSEALSHNANLLGGDVVNIDEHALLVLLAASLGVLPNLVLSNLLN